VRISEGNVCVYRCVPFRPYITKGFRNLAMHYLYLRALSLCGSRKKKTRENAVRLNLTVSNSNEKKIIRPQLTICVVLYEISSYIITWVNCGISLKCIIYWFCRLCVGVASYNIIIIRTLGRYQVNICRPIRRYLHLFTFIAYAIFPLVIVYCAESRNIYPYGFRTF